MPRVPIQDGPEWTRYSFYDLTEMTNGGGWSFENVWRGKKMRPLLVDPQGKHWEFKLRNGVWLRSGARWERRIEAGAWIRKVE